MKADCWSFGFDWKWRSFWVASHEGLCCMPLVTCARYVKCAACGPVWRNCTVRSSGVNCTVARQTQTTNLSLHSVVAGYNMNLNFLKFVNNYPSNTAIYFKSHIWCYMFEFSLKYLCSFYSDTERNSYKQGGDYVCQFALATEFSRRHLLFVITPHGTCCVSPSWCLACSSLS